MFVAARMPHPRHMKLMSPAQAETARRRAVTGLRNLGKDDDADRFDSMDAREYAEQKGIEIHENPTRSTHMAGRKTAAQLKAELEEANDYIEQLESKLDDIVGI